MSTPHRISEGSTNESEHRRYGPKSRSPERRSVSGGSGAGWSIESKFPPNLQWAVRLGMSRPPRNDLDYTVYAAPPLYPAEARCLCRLRHALSVDDCDRTGDCYDVWVELAASAPHR